MSFTKHWLSSLRLNITFALLTTFFLAAISQQNHAQDIAGQSTVRFFVISDWGGYASKNQKDVADAMGREAEKSKPQFVLTLGDNYHGKGIATDTDSRWKTEYEDIYHAPALHIPWYPALGNHDYEGSPEAELNYAKHNPLWSLKSRYYAFEKAIDSLNSILFVQLDTSPFIEDYRNNDQKYRVSTQDTKVQLAWLDSVLSHSHAAYIVVGGHHPIYSAASKHGDTKELITSLLPVLKKYNISIYLCGHDHIFQYIKRDNMNFLICGVGAAPREVEDRQDVVFAKGGTLGFVKASADKDNLTISLMDTNNNTLYSFLIKNRFSK